jgi:AcrR family transcriptional regulator
MSSPSPLSRRAPTTQRVKAVHASYDLPDGFAAIPAFLDFRIRLQPAGNDGLGGVILDAARRCAVQFGWDRVSMSDIATAAGASRASIYKYFADRDALWDAIMRWALDLYAQDLSRAMLGPATLVDKVISASNVARWYFDTARFDSQFRALSPDTYTIDSKVTLALTCIAIRPHLEAAAAAGEVPHGVELDLMCEWLARAVHTTAANPGVSYDERDPDDVARFLRFGLQPLLSAGSRPAH